MICLVGGTDEISLAKMRGLSMCKQKAILIYDHRHRNDAIINDFSRFLGTNWHIHTG